MNPAVWTIWAVQFFVLPLEAFRILAFFPFPGKSHHMMYQPLIRELANRGHDVVYLTPFPLDNPPKNLKEIVIKNIMDVIKGMFQAEKNSGGTSRKKGMDVTKFIDMDPWKVRMMMYGLALKIQEEIAQLKEIKELIQSDLMFDAVISSSVFLETSVALEHKFGAVGIGMLSLSSSHWINDVSGNPNNPSYIVDFLTPYTDRMSFFQRLQNVLMYIFNVLFGHLYYIPKTQALMDSYYNYTGWEQRPPMMDMLSNKSLVLLNSHPSVNYPYPMSPHIVEVAGIGIMKNKPLPPDLEKFMDEAKEGAIILSFGSNVEMSDFMEDDLHTSFVESLGNLKQRIVWKWEGEDFPRKPVNVKTVKWLPQQDLLAHRNCRVFVTHGGLASIIEAVHHGIPVVGIPLFGDQMKNMRYVTSTGFGVEIKFTNISKESISWAINEVLNNPSYRKAAAERSALLRDRPMSALDTAVFWTEYVIRHRGAKDLRPALASLKWYQSSLLDVILALAFTLLLTLVVVLYSVRCLFRLLCRIKSKNQGEKKKTN